MNHKVGILTFVKVDNYGAELQAFALSNTLRVLGYNAEIINFSIKTADNTGFESLYRSKVNDRKIGFHSLINKILTHIMRIFRYKYYVRRRSNFETFYINYLPLSKSEYKSFVELCNSNLEYSHVIVGSDQVWNYSMDFSVIPFLLSFLRNDINKISYAASFGLTHLEPYLKDIYGENLSQFTTISVREQSGAKIISELLKKEVPVVLDPTLLLSKESWCSLLNIKKEDSKYILIYMLTYSEELLNFAERLSSKTGMRVIQVMTSFFSYRQKRRGFCELYEVNPRDFVELVYNASYILTTSFHGTAFAVNFNKPFYTFVNTGRKNNSRMVDLLSKLDLEDRIIYDKQITNIEHFLSFDHHKSENKLKDLKEYSIQFLKTSLK